MKTSKLGLFLVMILVMSSVSPMGFAASDRMAEGGVLQGSVDFLDDFGGVAEPEKPPMISRIESTASTKLSGTQSTKASESKAGQPVIPINGYSRRELEGDNAPRCRAHPILKKRKTHAGCDMSIAQGQSVVSTLPGTVVLSKSVRGYGNFIVIKHKRPDGKVVYSRYGHLYKNSRSCKMASVGKKVSAGDKIGCVGSTGLSSGPHLHFEIRSSADGGIIYDSKHFVLSGGKLRKAPVC